MLLPSDSSSCKVPDHLPVTVYVPPLGEQARITCSPQVASGIDKLKVAVWFTWTNLKVFERLSTHKKGIQETERTKAPFNFTASSYSHNFVLHRTGTTKFTYRLSTADVTLMLSPRPGSASLHNVQIEIGSISCQLNAYGTYLGIIKLLESVGGYVEKVIVSEVHLAADLVGVDIRDTNFAEDDRWIKRADHFAIFKYRDRLSGITLGLGKIMFRAYDKILEMKTKRETAKQEVFAKLWGVDIEETPVTRCEFQLRREVLKEFTVPCTTPGELFDNIVHLWAYCSKFWARFCSAPVDRKNKHQSLSTLSEYWELVQSAFSAFKALASARVPQKAVKNFQAIADQFRGLAQSMAAYAGVNSDIRDPNVAVQVAQRLLKEELLSFFKRDPTEFWRRQQIRFNECYNTCA